MICACGSRQLDVTHETKLLREYYVTMGLIKNLKTSSLRAFSSAFVERIFDMKEILPNDHTCIISESSEFVALRLQAHRTSLRTLSLNLPLARSQ
jgi:hypothetical protein